MSIKRETISALNAVGSGGWDAVATATCGNIQGLIHAVHLQYVVGMKPPPTIDVYLYEDTNVGQTVLTVKDTCTDDWYYPMTAATFPDGTGIPNQGQLINVCTPLTLTIDQCNDGEGIIATIVYESNIP
jgi:hypothetical protein